MLPTPPSSPKPTGSCGPEDRIGLVLADQIELTDILGVGAYGTVYRARDVVTGIEYAVKALNKLGLDDRQRRFQDREIQLHFECQHPNVVSLHKILDSVECTYVVLEYCPEGDLFAKITEESHYVGDDVRARNVFLQILSAVQHCHARGVYHRDLKPENVLVKDNGQTVKLADFGLATQEPITSDFGCGSTFYMSPENQEPNPKPFSCYSSAPNDVWSLGVILVNLTCGRNPWKRASMDDPTFRAFRRDRNFLKTILPISDDLNRLLQRIFEVRPEQRITVDELHKEILRCRSFTAHTPPTPPDSPVEEPIASPILYEEFASCQVPPLDLPAQQYPPQQQQIHHHQQPQQCHKYYASPTGMYTPPPSGHCSPQQSAALYTYPQKSVNSYVYPSTAFAQDQFRRCAQVLFNNANFVVPQHVWTPNHW